MRVIAVFLLFMLQTMTSAFGQDASSYLIRADIGDFTVSGTPSIGKGPGILAGADHFYQDHNDMTYEIDYFNMRTKVGPEVQVTKHVGSDSDKWLLHEVEDCYRSGDKERLGLLSIGTIVKTYNGNRYYSIRLGGGTYMWISNDVVVRISFRSIQERKPEPLEVVQRYLVKLPSTIPPSLTLDKAHDVQWIKDEMERRLWLCEKWFSQSLLNKTEEQMAYKESVKDMEAFLDYREKYFYTIFSHLKAAPEKGLLNGYLSENNGTGIKAKLTEYKDWWNTNKGKNISL